MMLTKKLAINSTKHKQNCLSQHYTSNYVSHTKPTNWSNEKHSKPNIERRHPLLSREISANAIIIIIFGELSSINKKIN